MTAPSRLPALFVPALPLRHTRTVSLHRPLTATRPVAPPVAPPTQRPPARAMLDWIRGLAQGGGGKVAPPPDTKHAVLGNPLAPGEAGWPAPLEQATFGLGCFWGAERKFWQAPGVHTTSVGYAGGNTDNPNYRAVCSGSTGHAEVVNVVFDPTKTSYEKLLDIFWDAHDPTTKNRQGNDVGTQYRSAIYYFSDEQKKQAEKTRDHFNSLLKDAGRNACTTEIAKAGEYYLAEEYHQQYLHKNPFGYCGLGGTGVYTPPERKN